MPYTATHRHARISPTKVRPVAALIRGKKVDEASAVAEIEAILEAGATKAEKEKDEKEAAAAAAEEAAA